MGKRVIRVSMDATSNLSLLHHREGKERGRCECGDRGR